MKVDFEKVYDSVSWSYLEYILGMMDFAKKWCLWMRSCIFSEHVSILVNGRPTDEFQVGKVSGRGLLVPFLFLIGADGLTRLVRNTVDYGLYKALRKQRGFLLSIIVCG